MDKPIPPFYCCYLLRSTVRRASLYVGSTPNPSRRLKQHNGLSVGGATRTSRATLRPWEMTTVVTGFPSKVAALQFEWAWQNTHLTRHLTKLEREKRKGSVKPRRRPVRSLTDTLSDLHLLLRVKSFERWPLQVHFFAKDVYQVWQSFGERVGTGVRTGITITFTPPEPLRTDHGIEVGPREAHGVGSLDLGYHSIKPLLEKSLLAFAPDAAGHHCTKCTKNIDASSMLALPCPAHSCKGVWHLSCLSRDLLELQGDPYAIIPTQGLCPICGTEMDWSTLMKCVSLRSRGREEIGRLFKQRPIRRGGQESGDRASVTAVVETLVASLETRADTGDGQDFEPIPSTIRIPQSLAEDVGDDWVYLSTDDDDHGSHDPILSNVIRRPSPNISPTHKEKLIAIVEDSEDDTGAVSGGDKALFSGLQLGHGKQRV
ncbi:MAG: Slx4p interacting protein [Bathelium mastoideum]|nr:MAG: Slx4p interacting protein [Bathelium mastoideum]